MSTASVDNSVLLANAEQFALCRTEFGCSLKFSRIAVVDT